MKNRKYLMVIFSIVILNILLIVFLRNKENKYKLEFELSRGKVLPYFSISGPEAKKLSDKAKWTLFFFTDLRSSDEIRTSRFLETVSQKYSDLGLRIIGILKSSSSTSGQFSYPIINYDREFHPKNKLLDSLVRVPRLGIALLDSTNTIIFSTSFYGTDDIRQLVEKYIFGQITYPALGGKKALKIGDRFPLMLVRNLKENQLEYFPNQRERTAIFLTGRCPECVLSNFRSTYDDLEKKLFPLQRNLAFVFSSKFIEKEILGFYRNARLEVFLAVNNIPGIEDPFNSIYLFREPIVVVGLNDQGGVIALDSLGEFLKKLRINTK